MLDIILLQSSYYKNVAGVARCEEDYEPQRLL